MVDQNKKILVVDDDIRLRELLQRYLTEQGFTVKVASDAKEMDAMLANEPIDLLVLDLMLPGEDGLSICRRIRGTGTMLPIVMLTARGDEVDRIIGLEMGADDYLPKPFNPRELLARINAVMRRHERLQPSAPSINTDNITIGDFVFNASTRSLSRDGTSVTITSGEFALLKVFVDHPRQPLSRDRLMQLARGRELDVFDRSIDVQVSRLRKLIEPDPAHPRYLQTMWGFGYVFIPDGETDQ
ncbi:MAG: two-component system response regulator OmpR [Methylotenera sp.]|uniref:osmolarity response regulator transcription factor OmpR n=1 Tax=Methylotenera sp. TaxID=2051956 RepID=UPI002731F585|nr:two-component system response regulator OmpR [Methylotenera sp.]MDP1523720.1 two-component system response regulator OmpR [Methylotenera sp.]MDP3819196.1 two-component system response regulator OmpR [Methylotenera sp.]